MLRLWGREKSIALDWKARLVLSGQGTQDKENKAVCTKAELPLKARLSGGPLSSVTIFCSFLCR